MTSAAVTHSIAGLDQSHFSHLCGLRVSLPARGSISVVGPETGLGVAQLLVHGNGDYEVIESEGGHIDFAPIDSIDDAILLGRRERYGRVSVERLASGPGMVNIYACAPRRPRGGDARSGRVVGGGDGRRRSPVAVCARALVPRSDRRGYCAGSRRRGSGDRWGFGAAARQFCCRRADTRRASPPKADPRRAWRIFRSGSSLIRIRACSAPGWPWRAVTMPGHPWHCENRAGRLHEVGAPYRFLAATA